MWRNRPRISRALLRLATAWLGVLSLFAGEHHGQVTFNNLPVPGATVTASHDGKSTITTTDSQGLYSFADLADGTWSVEIQMLGFAAAKQDIVVKLNAPAQTWELKLLSLDQIKAQMQTPVPAAPVQPVEPAETTKKPAPQPAPQNTQDALNARAADGFLINGSVNNGAASPFSQAAAFGNRRNGNKSLYNGGIGFTFDNSTFDARSYSLTGQDTPKPDYNRMTGLLALGGPIRIPHLLPHGPNVFVGYQWMRNRNATMQSALVPTLAERSGNLSDLQIPVNRISPQAEALLRFYPLPNFTSNSGYNYQIPLVSPTHQDAMQSRFDKSIGNRDQVYGRFAFQSVRTDNPNLFNFLDTTDTFGINTGVNWSHRFNHRVFVNLGYQYSRYSTRIKPYFENRQNVSGLAGISGNNQDAFNWGPPSLVFSSGIAELTDSQSAFNRNQTGAVSSSVLWNRGTHNFQFGADIRRQQFNYLAQQDPRGTFTFTGAATGSAFADFLIGTPDVSSIAFGNADKYFRESVYDAYFTDDWRITPEFSLNIGMRWEYGAPLTELYGRLVNLDIAPGFSAVAPVLANNPVGSLTGQRYPTSLVHPDKSAFQPRLGIAWRPLSGSSMVIRAGYGIYYDSSVYQTVANQMAQQSPLSKSLSVQNTSANPLTLTNGFNASPTTTMNTFAIDPNFRIGYAQTWQASVQRDLPASLQLTAAYLGIKGTRGAQEFLPNTYPIGAANPCIACPLGFAYLVSNGNSTRESGMFQLRRRLHNGFTGIVQYTFSKSIDNDAALGGQSTPGNSQSSSTQSSTSAATTGAAVTAPAAATGQKGLAIAQNWLNLSAERSLSSFDQRHLLTLQLQYTTGMGLRGGTLLTGRKAALMKEWTFAAQMDAGSGLPQTPIYLAAVASTGVTGTIRANYTGQPLYSAPTGLYLNPAAYTAPLSGQWGNAGRNSITGPAQFTLNASVGRTFRLSDRFNLDLRVDSSNALNHVAFTQWNTTVNSTQFGLAASTNAMRSMQTTLRLRF